MRQLRYNVAATLDGFIATADGGYDWIVPDPQIDFAALFAQFDLFVMGRKTYQALRAQGDADPTLGSQVIVASRTLTHADRDGVQFIAADLPRQVAQHKTQPGKDIWLFGGSDLARTLCDAGLIDTIEVAVMPVILGSGIRLLPGERRVPLTLLSARPMPSGIQMLSYRVEPQR